MHLGVLLVVEDKKVTVCLKPKKKCERSKCARSTVFIVFLVADQDKVIDI